MRQKNKKKRIRHPEGGRKRGHKAEFQTERWQQLVGREFGGKNESKHNDDDDGVHAGQCITFF